MPTWDELRAQKYDEVFRASMDYALRMGRGYIRTIPDFIPVAHPGTREHWLEAVPNTPHRWYYHCDPELAPGVLAWGMIESAHYMTTLCDRRGATVAKPEAWEAACSIVTGFLWERFLREERWENTIPGIGEVDFVPLRLALDVADIAPSLVDIPEKVYARIEHLFPDSELEGGQSSSVSSDAGQDDSSPQGSQPPSQGTEESAPQGEQPPQPGGSSPQGSQPPSQGTGQPSPQGSPLEGSQPGGQDADSQGRRNQNSSADLPWPGGSKFSFEKSDFGNDEVVRDQASQQAEIDIHNAPPGTTPGGLSDLFEEPPPSDLPWRDQLALKAMEVVADATEYGFDPWEAAREAEMNGGYYLQTESYGLHEITNLVDTSGSMSLKQDLAMASGILSQLMAEGYEVTCVTGDTKVTFEGSFEELVQSQEWKGRGGTNMAALIPEVVERHRPQLLVVTTDGQTPWPAQEQIPSDFVVLLTRKPKFVPAHIAPYCIDMSADIQAEIQ